MAAEPQRKRPRRGFLASNSRAHFSVPSIKWWLVLFYDSAVSSTLNTNVTLMVSNIRISYLCQVPLVTLTPETLKQSKYMASVLCFVIVYNPILIWLLGTWSFNAVMFLINPREQGLGWAAPNEHNWPWKLTCVTLEFWSKHCCNIM